MYGFDEDIEDIYEQYELDDLFAAINRKERQLKDVKNPFEIYDDTAFIYKFRLSKNSVITLGHLLESKLDYCTNRNHPMPPAIQLTIALRFYATGAFQSVVGDLFDISQASVCRIVHKVSKAIALLLPNHIQFPRTPDEVKTVKTEFLRISNFPGIVGALDCTHIPIQSPGGNNAETFRNRKGYFSLNVQAIGDANLKFLDLVVRWPGSTHDSTIFSNCVKHAQFECGEINGILLGDNGYPNKTYLMTPLLNPQTNSEKSYNRAHIHTRNTIERQFGLWKRRFPCLSLGLKVHVSNAIPIIVACGVLHNIARDNSEHFEFLEETNNNHQDVPVHNHPLNALPNAVRQMFINQHFS